MKASNYESINSNKKSRKNRRSKKRLWNYFDDIEIQGIPVESNIFKDFWIPFTRPYNDCKKKKKKLSVSKLMVTMILKVKVKRGT